MFCKSRIPAKQDLSASKKEISFVRIKIVNCKLHEESEEETLMRVLAETLACDSNCKVLK